jgi:hypothetical protein
MCGSCIMRGEVRNAYRFCRICVYTWRKNVGCVAVCFELIQALWLSETPEFIKRVHLSFVMSSRHCGWNYEFQEANLLLCLKFWLCSGTFRKDNPPLLTLKPVYLLSCFYQPLENSFRSRSWQLMPVKLLCSPGVRTIAMCTCTSHTEKENLSIRCVIFIFSVLFEQLIASPPFSLSFGIHQAFF